MPHDLTRLTPWCVAITIAFIVIEVLFGAHSAMLLNFLNGVSDGAVGGTAGDLLAAQIDAIGGVIGVGYMALTVAAYILNGIWIYRASSNAATQVPDVRRVSPGWAVGWYFIPFANLWMPFKAMKQIWNSSHGGAQAAINAQVPLFLSIWWGAWILSGLLGNISFRMSVRSDDLETLIRSSSLDVASSPLSILSAILFLKIIRSVTRAQRDNRGQAEIFA